ARRARDSPHRIDSQAQEPRARRIACAARIRRISEKGLYAPRAVDGTHAGLWNRAAGRSHNRGPSRMTEYRTRFRRWFAGAVLLLAGSWTAAQQTSLNDVSSLLTGQQTTAGAASLRARTADSSVSVADELGTPRETMDAAALLGTEYRPAEGAMFGAQLFQPGMSKSYGQGFNDNYTLAIGDRVALRMWGAFSYEDLQTV